MKLVTKKVFICTLLSCLLFTAVPAFAAQAAQVDLSDKPGYSALQWYITSAERRAIYHEVYYVACKYVEVTAKDLPRGTWGVILDIDETTVDNSPSALNDMQANVSFSAANWKKWKEKEEAVALPGVKTLVALVHKMGGYVNFVSNGDLSLQSAYEGDLLKQGIYFDQVLLATAETSASDKNTRFVAIQKGEKPSKLPAQNIIAWFGDNIQDFPGLQQKDVDKWDVYDDALWRKFGNGWFILPNPIYGSWVGNKLQ